MIYVKGVLQDLLFYTTDMENWKESVEDISEDF